MTLPLQNNYPLNDNIASLDDLIRYIRDLTYQLKTRDEEVVQVVNGDIKGSAYAFQDKWTPILKGTVTPGTFTYVHQSSWSLRQGLFTELWFDVQWSSAGTAAGNLYLELPYSVAMSFNTPFVGVLQPSNINYGAGFTDLVINAIPDTNRGEIWKTGSTSGTANLAVVGSGQLIGHIRYIGQQNE